LISAGKIQSGCQDIRFRDSDGTTDLSYWNETACNSASTKFWVKIPSIPSGTKTIYMYYGNSSATTQSNFAATMLTVSSNPSFATYGSWYTSTYNTQTNPSNTLTVDNIYGYMYTADAWVAQDEGAYWIWDFGSSASRSFYVKWYDSATKISTYCMSFTTYVYVSPDGSSWTLIASNTLSGTSTSQVFTSNYNGAYRYVRVQQYSTTSCMVNGYTFVDGVWARKYVSPEPTTSIGTEEFVSTTTTTTTTTTTSSTTTTTTTTTPVNDQITLYPGWNMISLSRKTAISLASDNCGISTKLFHYYNSSTMSWQRFSWSQLIGGLGYYFNSLNPSPCNVSFIDSGTISSSDLPQLNSGYNLVGTKSTAPYTFSSVVGSCSVVAGPLYWNSMYQQWQTASNLQPTQAYWIYVNSACSLV